MAASKTSSSRANQKLSHSQRLAIERSAAHSTNCSREAALAFVDSDANGDGVLDFSEVRGRVCQPLIQSAMRHDLTLPSPHLLSALPQFKDAVRRLRATNGNGSISVVEEAELRTLFDSIDTDSSGTIEMDEYFVWTLDMAIQQGCGLEAVFAKYDLDGRGTLDANEFSMAVEDLGFSATIAHELFVELDDDDSGAVEYAELTETIAKRVGAISEQSKKLLTTFAFKEAHTWSKTQSVDAQSGREVRAEREERASEEGISIDDLKGMADTWSGSLNVSDADQLRVQLCSLLQHGRLRPSDLYNLLVTPHVRGAATVPLTRDVFVSSMRRIGYRGPPGMLLTLFKKIDTECARPRRTRSLTLTLQHTSEHKPLG
jgi:hypothetical protein